MDDVVNAIPPDAWPLIDMLFNTTLIVTGLWLIWTLFVAWRRSASNLTSVSSAQAKGNAEPDFLSVDEKARKQAIKRGEGFDKEMDRRDREGERAAKHAARKRETMVSRIGRLVSLGMALFSMATMISGTMFQVSIMGRYWEQYSASERLMRVVEDHPIGVTITVLVILYNLITFVLNFRKKQEA